MFSHVLYITYEVTITYYIIVFPLHPTIIKYSVNQCHHHILNASVKDRRRFSSLQSKRWSHYWVKLGEWKWDRKIKRRQGPQAGPGGPSSHQMSETEAVTCTFVQWRSVTGCTVLLVLKRCCGHLNCFQCEKVKYKRLEEITPGCIPVGMKLARSASIQHSLKVLEFTGKILI